MPGSWKLKLTLKRFLFRQTDLSDGDSGSGPRDDPGITLDSELPERESRYAGEVGNASVFDFDIVLLVLQKVMYTYVYLIISFT